MVKHLLISFSALSLVACNGNNGGDINDRLNISAEADFAPARLEAPQAMRKAAPDRVETENSADPAGVFLAYRYGVAEFRERHEIRYRRSERPH